MITVRHISTGRDFVSLCVNFLRIALVSRCNHFLQLANLCSKFPLILRSDRRNWVTSSWYRVYIFKCQLCMRIHRINKSFDGFRDGNIVLKVLSLKTCNLLVTLIDCKWLQFCSGKSENIRSSSDWCWCYCNSRLVTVTSMCYVFRSIDGLNQNCLILFEEAQKCQIVIELMSVSPFLIKLKIMSSGVIPTQCCSHTAALVLKHCLWNLRWISKGKSEKSKINQGLSVICPKFFFIYLSNSSDTMT